MLHIFVAFFELCDPPCLKTSKAYKEVNKGRSKSGLKYPRLLFPFAAASYFYIEKMWEKNWLIFAHPSTEQWTC